MMVNRANQRTARIIHQQKEQKEVQMQQRSQTTQEPKTKAISNKFGSRNQGVWLRNTTAKSPNQKLRHRKAKAAIALTQNVQHFTSNLRPVLLV
jgi:hypothetical protein